MKTFYFVGGPIGGQGEAFRRRLAEIGGSPPGWHIYPHASGDGQALHVVTTDAEESIEAHLAKFDPIYSRGPIVEVMPRTQERVPPDLRAVLGGRPRPDTTSSQQSLQEEAP